MVEETYSPEVADRIITEANLESEGAYTTVGTYPHSEMIALVSQLAKVAGTDTSELLRAFGRRLFGRFSELYPMFFSDIGDTFAFLETIDSHVHVEVRKLYPDAELPRFTCTRPAAGQLVMNYASRRPFSDLAHGLIEGARTHWKEDIHIGRDDSKSQEDDVVLFQTRFTLTLNQAE